jgi:hypothetical protein
MSLAAGSGTGVSLHVVSEIFAGICGGVTLGALNWGMDLAHRHAHHCA